MKTIKQLADEIGVSKQAIQKRIAREPLYTRIQPYIDKKGNTKYISDIGESIIKSTFLNNEYIQEDIDTSIDKFTLNDSQCTQLYIESLIKQIDRKDQQIEKLQNENIALISSLENVTHALNGAQALHAGTIQKELLEDVTIPVQEEATTNDIQRKSFFKKIFGNYKS